MTLLPGSSPVIYVNSTRFIAIIILQVYTFLCLDEPLADIHINPMGLLPQSHSCSHILTIIDRYTRWPEAVLLTSTMVPACASAFLPHWVSWFRVFCHLTLDWGPQFTSMHCGDGYGQFLGIGHHFTSSYHLQSNKVVERLHQTLKSALVFPHLFGWNNFPGSSLASARVSGPTSGVPLATW